MAGRQLIRAIAYVIKTENEEGINFFEVETILCAGIREKLRDENKITNLDLIDEGF